MKEQGKIKEISEKVSSALLCLVEVIEEKFEIF